MVPRRIPGAKILEKLSTLRTRPSTSMERKEGMKEAANFSRNPSFEVSMSWARSNWRK